MVRIKSVLQRSHLNREEKPLPFMHLPNTHKVKFMTWGDLKKMTQKAEEILQKTGEPSTRENTFLAVISVLNTSSTMVYMLVCLLLLPGCFISFYWAYVTNSCLWNPVTWVDAPFPIFNNTTIPVNLTRGWEESKSISILSQAL